MWSILITPKFCSTTKFTGLKYNYRAIKWNTTEFSEKSSMGPVSKSSEENLTVTGHMN